MFKINSEATANILRKRLNESLETSTFPGSLKLDDIAPGFKEKDPLRLTTVQAVFYILRQNYLKRLCRNK